MRLHRETNARVWQTVFSEKAKKHISFPWDSVYQLTEEERKAITTSIQIFQIGENSEGRTFTRVAREYAKRTGDHAYVDALQLFIKEEQGHAALLAATMAKLDIAIIETHWSDETFRWVRKLLGLELCIIILVTAELIAQTYYRALREATNSPLLRAICNQILRDEVHHIWFQGNTLRKLRQDRSRLGHAAVETFQHLGMLLACIIVWKDHKSVLKKGGYTLRSFIRISSKRLRMMNAVARLSIPDTSTQSKLREQMDIEKSTSNLDRYSPSSILSNLGS